MNVTMDQYQQLVGDRRVASVAVLLALLILIFSLVVLVDGWMPSHPVVAAPVMPAVQSTVSINQIPQFHLFGGGDEGALPETNLQLTLQGVLTDTDPAKSFAIIASAGSPGKVYRSGDTVMGGAQVYSIERDQVILRDQGRLEVLPLVRPRLTFQPPAPSIWENGE